MDWKVLAAQLFPDGYDITERENVLQGTATVNGKDIVVIGTARPAPGAEVALAQAEAVLETVCEHPRRPIVMLVNAKGQRQGRCDETLGINSYQPYLDKCIDLAWCCGHRVVGVVYDRTVSGGWVTCGLTACPGDGMPQAEFARHGEEELDEEIGEGRLAGKLVDALDMAPPAERRSLLGFGRCDSKLAQPVIDAVIADKDVCKT